jgi:hypothetical protein
MYIDYNNVGVVVVNSKVIGLAPDFFLPEILKH